MKILFLGPDTSPLIKYLEAYGETVCVMDDKLSIEFVKEIAPEFIISYGYRHMIKEDIIQSYPNRIINLHISFLPWNRGGDPNLWSFLEDTPKGVTIHYVDEGLDTGDIIVQATISFSEDETLKTSYEKLQSLIQNLFMQSWEKIKTNRLPKIKQTGPGTYHKAKDKESFLHLLDQGWDTKVVQLIGKAN